jgi:hypothetical protein
MRECGIVSQLTPAGTQQHNGVSKHRNRTLLDMVWSMTLLPICHYLFVLCVRNSRIHFK